MFAGGCTPKFFHAGKRVTCRGAIFAGIVAVFAVFDEVAGEGVYDFTVRTAAMCALVYAENGRVRVIL